MQIVSWLKYQYKIGCQSEKEWHSTKSKISNAYNAKQFNLHPNNALILNVKLFLNIHLPPNANSVNNPLKRMIFFIVYILIFYKGWLECVEEVLKKSILDVTNAVIVVTCQGRGVMEILQWKMLRGSAMSPFDDGSVKILNPIYTSLPCGHLIHNKCFEGISTRP